MQSPHDLKFKVISRVLSLLSLPLAMKKPAKKEDLKKPAKKEDLKECQKVAFKKLAKNTQKDNKVAFRVPEVMYPKPLKMTKAQQIFYDKTGHVMDPCFLAKDGSLKGSNPMQLHLRG